MSADNWLPTSNTRDCFAWCVGKRVIGVLFDALPVNRKDIARGTKTLIFDDGTGLTIADNGSFWPERPEEIARAVRRTADHLNVTAKQLSEVLALAGHPVYASDSAREDHR